MQYVGWLFSITMYVKKEKKKRKKRESTEWLDLGIHDPSTQDFSLSPLGHCLRLDVQYIVHSVLEHHEDTGRSQHSARCSDKVKIWIMLITPRISIPLSNCLMSPTDWFPIELSLSGTHLVTLGLLGCSLTDGGGPAGLCRLSLFRHIYPSVRRTYNGALCKGTAAGSLESDHCLQALKP